ncbi:MAG: EF-P lysine aminoacylase EpmA [Pirellulaceae bacterium]|nr:EF-P lysine aminoacylase EpmA [Pirellulaceae bacterium]
MPASSDFRPSAQLETLQQRARLLQQLRAFFHEQRFLEVETPILSADCVIDRHLDPLPVQLSSDPQRPDAGSTYWLQTSPEFAMKRLLAAGATSIYQVTHAFRAAESGRFHNPEFTMVEWYRVGDDQRAGMQLLADLCETLLPFGAAQFISYHDAFQHHLGIDPHTAKIAQLRQIAIAKQISIPHTMTASDRNEWLNLLLAEGVEPHLGVERPAILYDYPAEQAALAKIRPGNPPVAERFELYARGIELANGYHELQDAEELVRRNTIVNQQRLDDGKRTLPAESQLLEAMRHGLPSCAGVALGFDRLAMLSTGATSIRQVLTFPIDRA